MSALGALAGTASADGGAIMPLSQVQPGMTRTGESVLQGTTITSFGVQVIDVIDDPEYGARILVRVSGPAVDFTGSAEGLSGSPVMCPMPDGSLANAGALSAARPTTGTSSAR